MKRIFSTLFFALAIFFATQAQTAPKTAKALAEEVATQLKLDKTQTDALVKIYVDSETKLKAIQAGKGTNEEKTALTKAQINAADAEVKKLLGSEKYAEYKALQKKNTQGQNNAPGKNLTPEQKAKIEQYKKELGITDEQAQQLVKIHKEYQVTVKQIKAANKENPEAAKPQIKAAAENAKKQAAAVLTPEQQQKFVEMLQKEQSQQPVKTN